MIDDTPFEQRFVEAQHLQAVGRLATGVTHTLNNAMMVILNNSELLLRDMAEGDPNRRRVDAIRKTLDRVVKLTRRLARFGHKQASAKPVAFDLNELISGLEELIAAALGHTVQLQVTLVGDSLSIEADPGQVEQAIVNLALKVREAIPEGGKVCVETIRTEHHAFLKIGAAGCRFSPEAFPLHTSPLRTTEDCARDDRFGLTTALRIMQWSGGDFQILNGDADEAGIVLGFSALDRPHAGRSHSSSQR